MNKSINKILTNFSLVLATVVISGSQSIISVSQVPQAPAVEPSDDRHVYPYCPHELMFIHFDTYFYSVINCSNNSVSSSLFGFNSPVPTGCISNETKCKYNENPVVVASSTGIETVNESLVKLSKIPVDQLESAINVAVIPPNAANTFKVIVNDGAATRYFVLVKLHKQKTGYSLFRFAREIDGTPTDVSGWQTATIDANGMIKKGLDTFPIFSN